MPGGNTGGTSVGGDGTVGISTGINVNELPSSTMAGASVAVESAAGTTPTATANSLLAGGMDEPEVDPRRARGGLALIARAFREIGMLKTDVGKLKQ